MLPEDIIIAPPHLTLLQVHAVLSYHYERKTELELWQNVKNQKHILLSESLLTNEKNLCSVQQYVS